MADTKRLADVLPYEFMQGGFEQSPAMRLQAVDVVKSYTNGERPWPGREKFVSEWHVLANGKAVGWNRNPTRGSSFPVISYEATPRPANESIVVRFVSAQHESLHDVLISHGFSFTVSSDFKVGRDYKHPENNIEVTLTEVDEELEYACLKPDGQGVYGREDYNDVEWAWISDEKVTDDERLTRELHILLEVRPAFMTASAVLSEWPSDKGA